jgi:hypothetical protein
MRDELLVGRAAKRPIGLEGEVLPREPTNFESGGNRRLAIARGVELLLVDLGYCRSKPGGAYGRGLQLMAQFESNIPDPLRYHLPALLPPDRMRAPTIGVLFSILIC